ncbi:hypothetical protein BDP81DRAFT_418875 [Colletotrichum phormii]|uniref:Uncharacterized protein n=1 Tax=Colletotrichum phormii TaxID=359342 RepID=A0AAJ0A062_9PEZI|nr:uncharacterized protein BDP81DRAFT_418875 [Colletotrichum phormii]KAK1641413.1 hypothetical protein BDP81DRAFT_418875 [Colletotrichum phormii]
MPFCGTIGEPIPCTGRSWKHARRSVPLGPEAASQSGNGDVWLGTGVLATGWAVRPAGGGSLRDDCND